MPAELRRLDGTEPLLEMLDRLRERVVAGEVTGIGWASGNKGGSVSFGYDWGTRHGDRHVLCAAIAVLSHRFMQGYDEG